MNDTPRQDTAETDDDHLLDELVDRIIAKVQAGEPVELSHFAGAGPQRLVRLRQLLPAIQAATHMTGFGADPPQGSRALGHIELADEPAEGVLGDYQIVKEIGRGGMGVVYEAQQLSLGRTVALKVLPHARPFGAWQLKRFKNEARAAATLEHPHIVPVYGVGCERRVHFYAMQLIKGRNLAQVLRERAACAGTRDGRDREMKRLPPQGEPEPDLEAPSRTRETVGSRPYFASAAGGMLGTEDFREVGKVGVAVADALQHAQCQFANDDYYSVCKRQWAPGEQVP